MKKLLLIAVCVFGACPAWSAWNGPNLLVTGSFGGGASDFGIRSDYLKVELPHFKIDADEGRVVVADGFNLRVKIYNNEGGLLKTFGPDLDVDAKGKWPDRLLGIYQGKIMTEWGRRFQSYDFNGNFVQGFKKKNTRIEKMLTNGNVILYDYINNKFEKYSPAGELLVDYDQKPFELGVVRKTTYQSDGSGQHTVEYEDRTYVISSPVAVSPESFVRDAQGFLYGVGKAENSGNSDELHYLVYRFDTCGEIIGSLDLPENYIETIDVSSPPYEAYKTIVHEEYGPPVIGPDGSVYCWKRTPDTYSILKWTWVDDPNDPQPGPGAPANLKLTPSLDGLYLTWDASPQDPGCVDGYELERSSSADGIFTTVTTTDPGVVKFNDTSALLGDTYFYKVRAKSGNLYSPYSEVVSGSR